MEKEITVVEWVDFCRNYTRPGNTFATGKCHEIRIRQESVPIIFVPGIMGTRLSNDSGEIIWNPSNSISMLKHYGVRDAATMKANLAPPLHVVKPGEDSHIWYELQNEVRANYVRPFDWVPLPGGIRDGWQEKVANQLVEQGWDQVAWDNYIPFLMKLAGPGSLGYWEKDGANFNVGYNKMFLCPVYVFGYNWTEDNATAQGINGVQLPGYIRWVIQREKNKFNRPCNKVIIVTHSMGGLVTRAALKKMGGEANEKVLGVIHGAQPVTGAPVCYRRIRGGFEPEAGLSGLVLGRDYHFILPILGNCVGGLELLPSNNYKDNYDTRQWLLEYDQGKRIKELPGEDIYKIYSDQEIFERLVLNPDDLTPGEKQQDLQSSRPGQNKTSPFRTFRQNLDTARGFHDHLSENGTLYQHPNSYHLFAHGKETLHQVRWEYRGDVNDIKDTEKAIARAGGWLPMVDGRVGSGADVNPKYHPQHGGAYFEMDPPDPGCGDGTVPTSSSTALIQAVIDKKPKDSKDIPKWEEKVDREGRYCQVGPVEHGDFYNSAEVQEATAYFVRCLLDDHLRSCLG